MVSEPSSAAPTAANSSAVCTTPVGLDGLQKTNIFAPTSADASASRSQCRSAAKGTWTASPPASETRSA